MRIAISILLFASNAFAGEYPDWASFAEDREISEQATIAGIIRALGRDDRAVLERAQSIENKELLKARTDEAIRLGIFGAPSFCTRGELFWGNDRLEEALECCAGGTP